MYKKISDYAIIGDLHSIALVGLDGSVDWCCLPHIDSPSVFGALLDDKKGGCFAVTPSGDYDSAASYMDDTNILVTRFRTRTGVAHITDFMPVPLHGQEDMEEEHHELYRLIQVLEGAVGITLRFEPRFDYARENPVCEKKGKVVRCTGKNLSVSLLSTHDFIPHDVGASALWNLNAGDRIWLRMKYGMEDQSALDIQKAEKALRDTATYWREWLGRSETGVTVDLGPYREMVKRSALVLKLLSYETTGAIAAAGTTSLPEEIGGIRNWDYRYTWIRDASFTLQALFNLGHLSEMEGYLRWIEQLIAKHGAARLQVIYGLRGEEELPEQELTHLDGYKGSRPVRIGNAAAKQRQLDIYGELMDAALKLSDYVGKINAGMWPFLQGICEYVIAHWREKDHGIWEVRGGPNHFVYSKVMCWVAIDRGITIARRYGFPAELKKWEKVREEIKEEILRKGYRESKKSFVQHYDTDMPDSSNLLLPLLGFLPVDDPRILSTIEATRRELGREELLYRYKTEDGLPGGEGAFLLSAFWLIDCLIALGRIEEAERHLQRIERLSNHIGLFSEEYDVRWSEQLGNFPQAFTHIGYINSVVALCKAKGQDRAEPLRERKRPGYLLLAGTVVLNDGESPERTPSKDIIIHLKRAMNTLRGAFFDTQHGRVAYERMHKSPAYGEYVALTYHLKNLNLSRLQSRNEQVAFWINIYNVLVIHGVIELGIRDSVKEVRSFFRRVQYQIQGMFFSPDDIEHGILRGNRRPPHSLFKPFKAKDRRLVFSIRPVDPRIHFALVCASSSCPPIEIYTPENLDKELDISGKTFLNSGGVIIDKERRHASLSRIFKWYSEDFGKDQAKRLRFIASFLYEKEDADFLRKYAESIKISYQDYDWRLNRY